jgi:hypothetical protein
MHIELPQNIFIKKKNKKNHIENIIITVCLIKNNISLQTFPKRINEASNI